MSAGFRSARRNRKKNILTAVKVILFLLLVAGTVVLILYNKQENENTPKTAFLSTGTIENSFNADVTMIRDEYAVTAGFSGKVIAAVNEGDRVAAGAVIAYIVKPEYESDLEELREIEDKITAAQSVSSYVNTSQSAEAASLNEKIKDLTYQLSELSSAASGLKAYPSLLKELEDLFRMKNDIMMNTETADEYITQLKNERAAALARLGDSMREVVTQQAGVVSFYTDSESQNASGKAQAISEYLSKKGETGNLLSETALSFGTAELRYTVGLEVVETDIVARVTPDVTYYLAADITGIDSAGLSEGKAVTVKASGREFSVPAEVEELLQYGEKTYLLMKSSAGIAGTISGTRCKLRRRSRFQRGHQGSETRAGGMGFSGSNGKNCYRPLQLRFLCICERFGRRRRICDYQQFKRIRFGRGGCDYERPY